MAEQVLSILAAASASAYLMRAWLYGSIFQEARSWVEDGQIKRFIKITAVADRLQQLLFCPLCLAPYVCLLCLLTLRLFAGVSVTAGVVVETFAAAGIALLLYPRLNWE